MYGIMRFICSSLQNATAKKRKKFFVNQIATLIVAILLLKYHVC